MFSRNNVALRYNNYTKSLRNVKNTFFKKQKCISDGNKIEVLKETQYYTEWNKISQLKNNILNSEYIAKCSKILSTVPHKFNFSNEKSERFRRVSDIFSKYRIQISAAGVVSTNSNVIIEPIPEPPTPSPLSPSTDVTSEIVNQVNALGEPTFASLGLGGYTPVGLVQTAFEYLHVTLGIPWWEAIIIGTLIIRTILFPLVIIAQRNSAKMNNYLPQLQAIQLKMTEARQMGNQIEVARYSQEMMLFMKDKNLNPLKNMLVPLAQMPIFISFFMALREMSNVPVDSLRTGGLWWFTDLTLPDQFFLMPLITSATLYATIELGTDSAKLSSQNLQTMKYVLRALPLVIFPFTMNFPGAILCYWVSTNFISLAQVGILRIPAVRDYFKIEPLVHHKQETLPMKPKGFTEGLKESWTNLKITKELEERRRLDEMQFQRAGKGPVIKTYKYDPTKVVAAKKR